MPTTIEARVRTFLRIALSPIMMLAILVITTPPANAEAELLDYEWWLDAYQAERIWGTTRGEGVTVAVLDSGVNASLPDLAGVVLPGTDVLGAGTDGRTDTDPEKKGHGTSMAGLIAGQGRDQLLGVAPGARILPVHMSSPAVRGNPLETFPAAIRFAADHGAKIISMSVGANGPGFPNNCPTQVQEAIRYAVDKDAIVVASSGNEGDSTNVPQFPAACEGVLAVGAIDASPQAWASTQQQDYVDFGAPGVEIVSISKEGTSTIGTGTSPSAAIASGALALIRSAHPDLSARQIVARVIATARDIDPQGKDTRTGIGAIRPFQAITATVPANAPNPLFDALDEVVPSRPTSGPILSGSRKPSASADPTAANPAASSDDDSGSGFPLGFVIVMSLAAAAFVISTAVRRSRRSSPEPPPDSWPPENPPYPPRP